KIAADTGYELYSPSLRRFAQSEERWTTDLLDAFLRSPRALVPGTTMGFDGFEVGQDRTALLGYLATLN
ncbi:MAG: cytochrome c family protein, partial [Pseudomonadota bacterium]